ncbi:MAG: YkgJ family cysteine cluster protein [Aestuariibacter sp.]|nr:YkgJ family cysteine cluster protein [Aestuariibacter sp.]
MYKVNEADRIPVRTIEEAARLDAECGGFIGGDEKDYPKVAELMDKIANMYSTNIPRNFMKIMKQSYRVVDMLNTKTAQYSVCQKGCSHCCRVAVPISRMEAEYISRKTGRKINEEPRRKVATDDPFIEYCPFHDDKTASCTVHEHRPLACRIFFTFDDPKNCENSSTMHTISTDEGATRQRPVMQLTQWMTIGSEMEADDIRSYFANQD